MKYYLVAILSLGILGGLCAPLRAQTAVDERLLYVPAALLAAGIYVETAPGNAFFSKRQLHHHFTGGHHENDWDDYAQFVPLGAAVILPAFLEDTGIRSTYPQLIRRAVVSEALMLGITSGVKGLADKDRPNGAAQSFPSGHTAQAFLGAQILYLEYRDTNKWLAYAGYPVAAFVAAERIINDEHWVSDVLVGAAVGMLVPTAVYWAADKMQLRKREKQTYAWALSPIYTRYDKGLRVSVRF